MQARMKGHAETSEGKGTTPRLSDGLKDRQMDLHASRSPKAREDQTHQTRKSKGLAMRERERESGALRTPKKKGEPQASQLRGVWTSDPKEWESRRG